MLEVVLVAHAHCCQIARLEIAQNKRIVQEEVCVPVDQNVPSTHFAQEELAVPQTKLARQEGLVQQVRFARVVVAVLKNALSPVPVRVAAIAAMTPARLAMHAPEDVTAQKVAAVGELDVQAVVCVRLANFVPQVQLVRWGPCAAAEACALIERVAQLRPIVALPVESALLSKIYRKNLQFNQSGYSYFFHWR